MSLPLFLIGLLPYEHFYTSRLTHNFPSIRTATLRYTACMASAKEVL